MSRTEVLEKWITTLFPHQRPTFERLAGDASFRHYWRLQVHDQTYVIMDAPPDKEDITPFISMAYHLRAHGLPVPDVLSGHPDGFLLLSDLGDTLLLGELTPSTAPTYYDQALSALHQLNACPPAPLYTIPPYDHDRLLQELMLMMQWYLPHEAKTHAHPDKLAALFARIITICLEQPTVLVHRDYHSRNLLCLPDKTLAILDFQDAVFGPATYDLVSLLKDCYIDWPLEQVHNWAWSFAQTHMSDYGMEPVDRSTWLYWFDVMGLQRHLKCLGIFTRLCHRDQKPHYLTYLPRVKHYIRTVCKLHPEFKAILPYVT